MSSPALKTSNGNYFVNAKRASWTPVAATNQLVVNMDANERRKKVVDFMLKERGVNPKPDDCYKPRDGDIIAVGPPKSGTTWMQQILHQIRTKGDEDFDDICKVTLFISNPDLETFNLDWNSDQKCNPRVFKTHEAYGVIKTTHRQKHVVIVRDPYDAAYSMMKFINGFFGGGEDISEDDMINMLVSLNEKNATGNYNTFSSWWQHRNDPNVLFLFYEDLKRDLETMIKKISEFVEIPLTDEELRRVAYLCSFEYMSKNKEKFQAEEMVLAISLSIGLESWKPTVGNIRTDGGKVGEGSNIGPKLKATVDQIWKEKVEHQTGIKSYQDMYNQHSILKKL